MTKVGRPITKTADIAALKKLDQANKLDNLRPVIAYTMKHCGASYSEIGEVFEVTKQRAEQIVKQASAKI